MKYRDVELLAANARIGEEDKALLRSGNALALLSSDPRRRG